MNEAAIFSLLRQRARPTDSGLYIFWGHAYYSAQAAPQTKVKELPEKLRRFIEDSTWIFAKTYAATWPHEYIVQQKVDNELFLAFAAHIDTFGYESEFYTTKQIYFDCDGLTYWHMGNIINRCPESETYQCRKAEGRLPENFAEKL